MEYEGLKKQFLDYLLKDVNVRIKGLQLEMESLSESAAADGKSSMGDKYETSREMAAQEMNRLSAQLVKLQEIREAVVRGYAVLNANVVSPGTMVIMMDGRKILIGPGIGIVNFLLEKWMVLSQGSPVGNSLLGKKIGDKVTVAGIEGEIKYIC